MEAMLTEIDGTRPYQWQLMEADQGYTLTLYAHDGRDWQPEATIVGLTRRQVRQLGTQISEALTGR